MHRTISKLLAATALGAAMLVPAYAQRNANADCSSTTAMLLSFLRPLAGTDTPDCPTLVGTWQVMVSPDGAPSFTAYNVFTADGNSTEFDNSNPPGSQTVAVGPWKKTGPNQYAFVEVNQLFDPQGNFAGTFRVKASVTLDDTGDKMTSTFQFTVSDPDGNVVFQGTGTAAGTRVKVD